MSRTLYHYDASPFCEKVRLALALEGLTYESVETDPQDPEPVRRISGQDEVPVLVLDDGTILTRSNRILRHLAGRPGARLQPDGRRDQALTWVLVDRADSILGPLCTSLMDRQDPDGSPLRDDDLRVLERRLHDEFAVLEGILERGPFLFGERPTVADVAVHAFISRLPEHQRAAVFEGFVRASHWYDRVLAAAR